MVSNKLLNESAMMMHDQNKIFANEFYHSEGRYMDDGMIDELMITNTEHLGDMNDMNFNKSSNIHHALSSCNNSGILPLNTEDYYQHNQYAFNQINGQSNGSSHVMNGSNTGAYFHTLQVPHNYNHQIISNSASNSSYLSMNPSNTNYGLKAHHNGLLPRSPSCGNTSSSSSSSPSSTNPNNNNHSAPIHHNQHSSGSQNSLLVSPTMSICSPSNIHNNINSSKELDCDSGEKNSSAIAAASEHAEMIRQKQLRGCVLTQDELQLLAKDRQRKDNHNAIERRRRFNINDRIKELGQLLPKHGEHGDTKQNKGSILKATVDYISNVRVELDKAKKVDETNKHLINIQKKLNNKIKELENLCRVHGISFNQSNPTNNSNYLIMNNGVPNSKPETDQTSNSNPHIPMSQFNNINNHFQQNHVNFNDNGYSNLQYGFYNPMPNDIHDSSNFEIKSKDQIHGNDSNTINPIMQIFQTNNNSQIGNNQLHSVSQNSIAPSPPKKAKQDLQKRKVNTLLSDQQLNKSFETKKDSVDASKTESNNGLKEEPISPKRENHFSSNTLKANNSPSSATSPVIFDKKTLKSVNSEEEEKNGQQSELSSMSINEMSAAPKSPSQSETSLNKLLMVFSSKDPMMSSSISSPSAAKSPVGHIISSETELNQLNDRSLQ